MKPAIIEPGQIWKLQTHTGSRHYVVVERDYSDGWKLFRMDDGAWGYEQGRYMLSFREWSFCHE